MVNKIFWWIYELSCKILSNIVYDSIGFVFKNLDILFDLCTFAIEKTN